MAKPTRSYLLARELSDFGVIEVNQVRQAQAVIAGILFANPTVEYSNFQLGLAVAKVLTDGSDNLNATLSTLA